MLKPFQIHGPDSVERALGMLDELGEDAAVYGGGTELLQVMKAGFLHYQHLVDIKKIPDLQNIRYESESRTLVVGAAVTHRQIELSSEVQKRLPILVEVERQVANVRVRSQGTLGGNLCFAEPHSDPATLLLVLEACVIAEGAQGQREISIGDLIVDAFETSLETGEVLTTIRIPTLQAGAGAGYQKFGIYERPTLGVAVVLIPDPQGAVQEARIAVGCVDAKPKRIPEAESYLKGVALEDLQASIEKASKSAAEVVDPVDDLHGSVEYKRHLVDHFVQRTATRALEQVQRSQSAN